MLAFRQETLGKVLISLKSSEKSISNPQKRYLKLFTSYMDYIQEVKLNICS